MSTEDNQSKKMDRSAMNGKELHQQGQRTTRASERE